MRSRELLGIQFLRRSREETESGVATALEGVLHGRELENLGIWRNVNLGGLRGKLRQWSDGLLELGREYIWDCVPTQAVRS